MPHEYKRAVMKRLPVHLWDFRRKPYNNHVKPFLERPDKLKTFPKKYETVLNQEGWDKYLKHVLKSPIFKSNSEKGKEAILKSKFPHRTGRGGYSGLKLKLVNDGKVAEEDLEDRCFMWAKARENKKKLYQTNLSGRRQLKL